MEEQLGRISVTGDTEANERIWRMWDLGEELMKTVTVDARCCRPELEAGDLLPGLPNDITLGRIVSKLPWSAFAILSSVSRQWREAIESWQVFDARVRSNSTETFIVIRTHFKTEISHYTMTRMEISLYSIRDKRFYQLPRIPHLQSTSDSGITSVDGKIYVLGGWSHDRELFWSVDYKMLKPGWSTLAKRVYVFDPAGQRKWRRCADMLEPKHDVCCAVVEGKIYVFRGVHGGHPAHTPEVYDPKTNAWSQIAAMPSSTCLFRPKVLTLGEEMFLLDEIHDLDEIQDEDEIHDEDHRQMLAYHTVKDEWRVVKRLPRHVPTSLFIAQGKFHVMTDIGIDVLDDEKNVWQHLHSHPKQSSTADAEEADDSIEADEGDVIAIVDEAIAVNDELYGIRWSSIGGSFPERDDNNSALLRSIGFRSDRDELMWQQEAAFQEDFTLECTVQL